jgi:serine/threonine-protein kinase CLA4
MLLLLLKVITYCLSSKCIFYMINTHSSIHSVYSADQFMNPGPAPRPPAERPRLTTVPSSPSVATSFNQMSLNSPSTPTLSIFPNSSSLTLSQTKGSQGSPGVAVIKEGYVRCKEDKFLAQWNQRYLILREFRLDFLKNETGKLIMSINLSNITGVTRSEDTKMAFEITRLANTKDANSKAAIINRDVPTKTITCEVKNDDEIYDWIDKIYERCPGMGGVSNPTNFSHRVHVGFDPKTGAFVGLPTEWEKLLTASAITKEDYKKNPQAVIEVLEFYSDIKMREQNPQYYSSMTPTPPASNSVLGNGNGIAPPRPPPPNALQRLDSSQSQRLMNDTTSAQASRKNSDADRSFEVDRMREVAEQEQRRRMEEEARRIREEQERREQEAYNASIPKTRVPLAKQELGGYGSSESDSNANRYNPSRPAPQAPNSASRQQAPAPLRQITAQRPAPSPPTDQKPGKVS